MEYTRVSTLLRDKDFLTELLNGACRPRHDMAVADPIPTGWIDEDLSEKLTAKYQELSAQDGSFINRVIVVKDPELQPDAVTVEHDEDKLRYILLTLIPDAPLPYQLNFPLMQTMGILTLISWEFSRACTAACKDMAKVDIVKEPIPPILNAANVEWVSIYVGKEPFAGRADFLECYAVPPEEKYALKLNLYKAREMEENSVITKVLRAYEEDVAGIKNCTDQMAENIDAGGRVDS